jgi:hypothetical protein
VKNMGNAVQLSNIEIYEGVTTDGSIRPGAQVYVEVTFDPVGAGCDTSTDSANGFCSPGADITWYVNGQYYSEGIASGYNGSLGGYATMSPLITAPDSGTLTITAVSKNQLTVSAPIAAVGSEPGAGSVAVSYLTCGNSPNYECSCESNGELVLYYTYSVVSKGTNGVGYVDVYVDGDLVSASVPTSTTIGEGSADGSTVISCPSSSGSHTILVRGNSGDGGASVTLAANTPMWDESSGSDVSTGDSLSYVSPIGVVTNTANNIQQAIQTISTDQTTSSNQTPQATTGQLISGVDNITLGIIGGAAAIAAVFLVVVTRNQS